MHDPGPSKRRQARTAAPGTLLFVLAGCTAATSVSASPVSRPTSSPSSSGPGRDLAAAANDRDGNPPTPTAATTAISAGAPLQTGSRAVHRKRQATPRSRAPIPPRYISSDGQWIEDYGWTLRGRGTLDPGASGPTATILSTVSVDAMADHVPTTTSGSAAASETSPAPAGLGVQAATASPSSSSSTQSASPISTSVSIPTGWQAIPRETNYYAVPLVIAMSVLVAVLVVISIFISVIVRRRKRRRRKASAARRARRLAAARGEVDGEGGDEAEGGAKEVPAEAMMQEKGWRVALGKVTGRQGRRRRRKAAKRAAAANAGAVPREGEDEVDATDETAARAGGPPNVRRRVRVTGFAGTGMRGSLRRRRRDADGANDGTRRSGAAGDADDGSEAEEERALTRSDTRSSAASIVEDTLTHRVASRLRRSHSGSEARPAGRTGANIFSRDVPSGSVVSLTASALDRVGSRSSQRSHRTGGGASSSASIRSTSSAHRAALPPPEILFTPADDPTLPDHLAIPGSPQPAPVDRVDPLPPPPLSPTAPDAMPASTTASFGALVATDTLPAPGPPAYRPSSSTVQRTRRFADPDHGAEEPTSRFGAARRRLRRERPGSAGARGGDRAPAEEDEGEWHWPGEKGWPLASGSSTSGDPFLDAGDAGARAGTSAELDGEEHPPPVDRSEEEHPPPVDRSLFTAHVATDDKAVLARLRQQRAQSPFVLEGDEGDVEAEGGSSSWTPTAGLAVPVAHAPSAPPLAEDDDLDDEGFERYDFSTPQADTRSSPSARAAGKAAMPSSSSTSLLPAPPQRIAQISLPDSFLSTASSTLDRSADFSSASSTVPLLPGGGQSTASYFPPDTEGYSSAAAAKEREARAEASGQNREDVDGVDEEALPMYLPGSARATETLGLASAPAAAADEDDEEEEPSVTEAGLREGDASRVWSGGDREEEGIV
ncbi:hypothetical protein JCM8202_006351 [Rhodotorula sphaerocarpa]